MKQYFLLAVLFFAYCSALAQGKAGKAPPLTKEQEWFKNQLQTFHKQHNVNINKEMVVEQFVQLMQQSKDKICPRAAVVEKLKLSGERVNNESVKLKWYTISQKGGKKFAIQRLFYNTASKQFEHVGYLHGLEKAFGKAEYEMLDNNTSTAKTYYRLQVMDTDGKLSYSETISVDGYKVPLTVKVLPNPATANNISIELTGFTASENVKLMIMDAKGSVVFSKQNVALGKSGGFLRLPSMNLTRGVYHIKVLSESRTGSTTFLVQ